MTSLAQTVRTALLIAAASWPMLRGAASSPAPGPDQLNPFSLKVDSRSCGRERQLTLASGRLLASGLVRRFLTASARSLRSAVPWRCGRAVEAASGRRAGRRV